MRDYCMTEKWRHRIRVKMLILWGILFLTVKVAFECYKTKRFENRIDSKPPTAPIFFNVNITEKCLIKFQ